MLGTTWSLLTLRGPTTDHPCSLPASPDTSDAGDVSRRCPPQGMQDKQRTSNHFSVTPHAQWFLGVKVYWWLSLIMELPSCRRRQDIFYPMGMQQTSVHGWITYCYRTALENRLRITFIYVRVYYWTTVEWKDLLPGSPLSHLDYWSRDFNLSLASGICIVAYISQWFLCYAQFHLRGRGWTNSSTLFNDWTSRVEPLGT